ncbi:hypothetical protein EBME_0967 [bacterium endosymbiont of Mortierella elongata FMR23-6]|nr:hypothetical protein EBME_0967 [bacterium endosymbiont of Mortierella elongata FMR23-6]
MNNGRLVIPTPRIPVIIFIIGFQHFVPGRQDETKGACVLATFPTRVDGLGDEIDA